MLTHPYHKHIYADQGIKFTPEDRFVSILFPHIVCGNRMDTKLVACDEAEDLLVLYTIILMSVTLYGLYSALFFFIEFYIFSHRVFFNKTFKVTEKTPNHEI